MRNYDREVKQVRSNNKAILNEFQLWLRKSDLAPNTVESHLDNIGFFAEYLIYYEPLCRLDEANDSDVHGFLMDWYPHKAMWASEAYTKAYMASFRKFFKYLRESNRIEQTVEDEVRETLKENKEEFLDAVAYDDIDSDW